MLVLDGGRVIRRGRRAGGKGKDDLRSSLKWKQLSGEAACFLFSLFFFFHWVSRALGVALLHGL